MSSVTTLGTSGSDGSSTLGGMDQSCADFVLMASPVRGGAPFHLSFLLDLCNVQVFQSNQPAQSA